MANRILLHLEIRNDIPVPYRNCAVASPDVKPERTACTNSRGQSHTGSPPILALQGQTPSNTKPQVKTPGPQSDRISRTQAGFHLRDRFKVLCVVDGRNCSDSLKHRE